MRTMRVMLDLCVEGNPIPEDPVRPIDMDIVVVNVVVIVAVIG